MLQEAKVRCKIMQRAELCPLEISHYRLNACYLAGKEWEDPMCGLTEHI